MGSPRTKVIPTRFLPRPHPRPNFSSPTTLSSPSVKTATTLHFYYFPILILNSISLKNCLFFETLLQKDKNLLARMSIIFEQNLRRGKKHFLHLKNLLHHLKKKKKNHSFQARKNLQILLRHQKIQNPKTKKSPLWRRILAVRMGV